MPTLRLETFIAAPQSVCFDAARDMGLHQQSASATRERIVAGKTEGLLKLGDEVLFEAVHLGVRQRLGAKITVLQPPNRFEDEMTRGAFASLRHIHEFEPSGKGTLMVDTLVWSSPLGLLGHIADRVLVYPHMERFLCERNAYLKSHLEGSARKDAAQP